MIISIHVKKIKETNKYGKGKIESGAGTDAGQVGDLVFKHYGDAVVVGSKPDRSGVSRRRHNCNTRSAFARRALWTNGDGDPEKKALYAEAAKASGKPLFH